VSQSAPVTEDAAEKLLVRLREGSLFLVKSDGVTLAALGTLASVFKIEGRQALEAAASLVWLLKALGFLLAGSLTVWGLLVMLAASSNDKSNSMLSRMGTFLFGALVFAHAIALVYSMGFLTSYLEHLHGS